MTVTFYSSSGPGKLETIGKVRMTKGTVVWDSKLNLLLKNKNLHDARTGEVLDPADGADYMRRLPYVFDNPPYLWAVLED